MATYSDSLRARLAQISDNGQDATTWEQLKAARAKRNSASQASVGQINQQTAAYNARLENFKKMYGGGAITPRRATESELAKIVSKKKKIKPKGLGSGLGASAGSALDAFASGLFK